MRYPYLQDLRADRASITWTTRSKGTAELELSGADVPTRLVKAVSVMKAPEESGLPYTYYRHTAQVNGLSGDNFYSYKVLHNKVSLVQDSALTFQTRGASSFHS